MEQQAAVEGLAACLSYNAMRSASCCFGRRIPRARHHLIVFLVQRIVVKAAGHVLENFTPPPPASLSPAPALQTAFLANFTVDPDGGLHDQHDFRIWSTQRFFRSVSLFKGLGERDLDRLVSAFQLMTLEAGDVLCREGERVDHVYLVQRGNLRLLKAFLPLPQGQARDRPEEKVGAEVKTEEDARKGERAHVRARQRQKQRRQERQPIAPSAAPPGASSLPNSRRSAATTVGDCSGSSSTRAASIPPPSPSSPSSPMKVRHFEIGMTGRKEFIGEGGFTSAAFAGAGALGAAGVEAKGGEEGVAGRARGREKGRGGGGGGRKHSQIQGRGFSHVGGNYLVSAVAERGADVFAAKVSQLWPMQSPAIQLCWIEGREVGQACADDKQTCGANMFTIATATTSRRPCINFWRIG